MMTNPPAAHWSPSCQRSSTIPSPPVPLGSENDNVYISFKDNSVCQGLNLQQEAQRATYRAPEFNVPPFWQISQGGHLVFPIGQKNTNLVEDLEILLPVKFRWIPFSGFRGEVENVSANQRPGWPSCFSDRPEKHKLGRGRWDLASCQVSLNSVQRFQRRSRKCLSQSEARAAILFFPIGRKKHKLGRGRWDLPSLKFRQILFSGTRGEVENVKS